jgi:hypothetical protein
MTPARQSEMIENPTNVEPNSPSWISSPGTKNRYASAVPAPDVPFALLSKTCTGSLVSSGAKSAS